MDLHVAAIHSFRRSLSQSAVIFTALRLYLHLTNRKYRVIQMIVGVLTTCHTQYTSDRRICVFLFNPLNPELNPICYLLALLGAHHFLHVSRIRVKLLTFRRLMLYIYMEHPFLMFLDHTQRRSTGGRTPLDE